LRVARLRGRNPGLTPWRKRNARSWQTFGPGAGPSAASTRSQPLIFGLTAVWNEGDVIWATVRNLFAQGADEVFVIDEESSDETREEAQAAGGRVVAQATSGVFAEAEHCRHIRRVIEEQTTEAGGDVWWIVVDADEFPRGPDGVTIRELVAGLPPWVDTVGSRVLEHLPDAASSYEPRTHPAASIPLAHWYNDPFCPHGHWKHQLFRVRSADDLYPLRGHHTVGAGDGRRIREASPSLLMHHVPFRDRTRTETRLSGAVRYTDSPDEFTRLRIAYRLRVVGDLYENRHHVCENDSPGEPLRGITLRAWRDLVPEAERVLPELQ
jgi:hypothetical protein